VIEVWDNLSTRLALWKNASATHWPRAGSHRAFERDLDRAVAHRHLGAKATAARPSIRSHFPLEAHGAGKSTGTVPGGSRSRVLARQPARRARPRICSTTPGP